VGTNEIWAVVEEMYELYEMWATTTKEETASVIDKIKAKWDRRKAVAKPITGQ